MLWLGVQGLHNSILVPKKVTTMKNTIMHGDTVRLNSLSRFSELNELSHTVKSDDRVGSGEQGTVDAVIGDQVVVCFGGRGYRVHESHLTPVRGN